MTMERYAALIETPIGADIRRHLENPGAIFVFPSQDSADSWAQALVKSGACRAVALDRFFGFEHFLRHCTTLQERGGRRTLQPVDKWVWALEVLNAQEDSPGKAFSLKRVLPSAEASTTQLSRLVGLIPCLYEVEALRKDQRQPLPYGFLQEEFEELELLARHYRSYLERNHLLDGHMAPLALPSGTEVRAYGLIGGVRAAWLRRGGLERQRRVSARLPGHHVPRRRVPRRWGTHLFPILRIRLFPYRDRSRPDRDFHTDLGGP